MSRFSRVRPGEEPLFFGQQLHQRSLAQRLQQVQGKGQRSLRGDCGPGQLKDHRAADAVVGELDLSLLPGQNLRSPVQGHGGLRPDALQGAGISGVGPQLDQRRVQLGAAMAQAPEQLIAVSGSPQLGRRRAAGGDDHLGPQTGVQRRWSGESRGAGG